MCDSQCVRLYERVVTTYDQQDRVVGEPEVSRKTELVAADVCCEQSTDSPDDPLIGACRSDSPVDTQSYDFSED